MNRRILAVIDSRARCHDNAMWRLCSFPVGTLELLTTDSLSPNMKLSFTGTANNFSSAWGLGLGNANNTSYMFYENGRNLVN